MCSAEKFLKTLAPFLLAKFYMFSQLFRSWQVNLQKHLHWLLLLWTW